MATILNTGTILRAFNSSILQFLSSGQLPYEIRHIPILLPSLQIRTQRGLVIYPGSYSQEGVELGLEPRQWAPAPTLPPTELSFLPRATGHQTAQWWVTGPQ